VAPALQELLYPRPFLAQVQASAAAHAADPLLVYAVMREESRFNPRARSAAAARGLMQLVLDTARAVARGLGRPEVVAEQLYDPAQNIELGARYLGELQRRFGGNLYAAAAAYNAGPNQAALWQRLQPAPGDDYFYSLLNYDETKDYVGKVMDSYRRYAAQAPIAAR
jgi:soluble lytic murein transglycosylase